MVLDRRARKGGIRSPRLCAASASRRSITWDRCPFRRSRASSTPSTRRISVVLARRFLQGDQRRVDSGAPEVRRGASHRTLHHAHVSHQRCGSPRGRIPTRPSPTATCWLAGVIVGVDPDPKNKEENHKVEQGVFRRLASPFRRWRLCEFHDGGGPGPRKGFVPRQLRPPGHHQEEVRSLKLLPREPEHQTCCLSGC